MSSKPETILSEFFDVYALAVVDGDAERIAGAYSSTYMEAGPSSVTAYDVDESYKKALRDKSTAMREQFGLSKAEIDIRNVREFAPSHFVVDGEWTMCFGQSNKDPIKSTFKISYVVRLEKEKPAILLYVSHEDEGAVMKRDGVI